MGTYGVSAAFTRSHRFLFAECSTISCLSMYNSGGGRGWGGKKFVAGIEKCVDDSLCCPFVLIKDGH